MLPATAASHRASGGSTSSRASEGLSERSQQLVRTVRAELPAARVTGQTAAFVDQQASLAAHLPWALAILALTTCTLIFLFTGSVVLPLKSLVMNVLTLGASFGILVRRVRVGPRASPGLESTQPILLCATAFGLSTDYAIFLFSRIKEARDRGLQNRDAVADGLERTGRVVTAAALLFCVAIGTFATSGISFIQELGVGTAVAVALDATIIRALLVPSLMALLGAWNWWAPAPLRRLHLRLTSPKQAADVEPQSPGPAATVTLRLRCRDPKRSQGLRSRHVAPIHRPSSRSSSRCTTRWARSTELHRRARRAPRRRSAGRSRSSTSTTAPPTGRSPCSSALHAADARVRAVRFKRNFGQHPADARRAQPGPRRRSS